MRHLKSGRKLGRNSSHRKAMFRNMVTSLLLHGQIRTTLAKAKELRRHVEKIITIARNNALSNQDGLTDSELQKVKAARLHGLRRARVVVNDKVALEKLFGDYAERYKTRPGGYTRVIKAGFRPGDNAPMAYITLVNDDVEVQSTEEAIAEESVDESAPEEVPSQATADEKSEEKAEQD